MAQIKITDAVNVIEVIEKGFQGPKGDTTTGELSTANTIFISGSSYQSDSVADDNLIALIVTGSIIPEGDGNWDLGSTSNQFNSIFSEDISISQAITRPITTKANITQNTTIPAGITIYNVDNSTDNSVTIAEDIDLTIAEGASATIFDLMSGNESSTFTGGEVATISSVGQVVGGGGVGNLSVLDNDVVIPPDVNMALFVSQFAESITISEDVNYTISENSNVSITMI